LISAPARADGDRALLEMRGITVRFGGLIANDQVDFKVRSGEIRALLGENGAGKSTLMRVLAGLLQPQAGQILIDGAEVRFASALDASRLGVGMVHQHFMLIPTLTVAQNLCLGMEGGRFFPGLKAVAKALKDIETTHGLRVDPNAMVGSLSVGSQQRVEIIKALYRGARILVLDEPTAVLAPQEVEGLFAMLRALAARGAAIVFISHKLQEVMALTHEITVLRQGRVVATRTRADTTERELARLMIGQDIALPRIDGAAPPGSAVALDASSLSYCDERGVFRLEGVNLAVRAGEIVGVAGVDGNGQHELAELIVGLRRPSVGAIRLGDRAIERSSIRRRIDLGMAHIPEDRQRTGLVGELSIRENAVIELVGRRPYARNGWIDAREIDRFARGVIDANDIRCTGPGQRVDTLSGGNQQKLVLGRALARHPSVIVAVQPTRGLDVGATAFVHSQLIARRAEGAAVVLISTEIDEVLALADWIVVMFGGRVAGRLARADATLERLGQMMTGQAA
jgi:general nucleoside transport system ATP-binding protein